MSGDPAAHLARAFGDPAEKLRQPVVAHVGANVGNLDQQASVCRHLNPSGVFECSRVRVFTFIHDEIGR
jgi:hypothetical protein